MILEYKFDILVMVAERLFYLFDFKTGICLAHYCGSKLVEYPHDTNFGLNGPFAVEYAGQHKDAMFGENIRRVSSPSPTWESGLS